MARSGRILIFFKIQCYGYGIQWIFYFGGEPYDGKLSRTVLRVDTVPAALTLLLITAHGL